MPLFAVAAPEPAGHELAHALVTGPFSRALTLAIDHSGLGLARLKGRLATAGVPVSTTTLSYWRTGRTRPERPESLRAVAVLEGVLGLPANALTDLLARPGDGRPVTPGPLGWERLWEPRARVLPVLHSFDAADETSLVVLSLHEALHVDATRALTRLRVREVVRAVTEPVQAKVVVLRGCAPGRPPRLVSTRYCRAVRTEVLAEPGFVVSELVPHRALAVGETAILEYEFEYSDGVPDTRYDRRFRHPGTEHLLEVHFAPAAQPATCHAYRLDTPAGRERDVTAVPLSPSSPAHVFTGGAPRGIRGLRWSWP
ncbi:hypothetical protein [Amycolatopsis sp. CA-128772]|uniref:hypothetical protein n=1 Tax=Amycolatopsis sp. CA-128772 TaxID=2073159 RepID=UPI000CD02206|nr:hypothetical protein [Amycolatopsis sp. CA-128772]